MALELRYEPLSELLRAPRNPKDHDVGFLHRSMGRWGFTDPALLDERTGRLVAGHGRLDTLEAKLGAGEDPPENVSRREDGEWLVPVIRGWRSRSDEDAEAYLVADNRATELGGWDAAPLVELLEDHRGNDLDDLGFSPEELDALVREVDPARGIEWREYDEDAAKDVRRVECPECGHEFPI